ncbi:MAG: LPXTG cell wall anchor domain-containing protein [Actinomycetes bacterium]
MRQFTRTARRGLAAAGAAVLLVAGPAAAQEAVDCEVEGSAIGNPVCDEDAEVLDLVLVDDPDGDPVGGDPADALSVRELPATGVDSGVLALTAGGIVVLGGAAVVATRRRKAEVDVDA